MKNIYIILALLLCSCNAAKQFEKAHDRLEAKDNLKKKAIPADKCASWYPPKTFTKEVIKYTKGKTDTVNGDPTFVYVDCDSVIAATLDELAQKHVAVKCPPSKTIYRVDTITDTVTIQVENTARIESLGYENEALKKDVDKYQGDGHYWKVRAWWTWGILIAILILVLLWKFFKPKI